MIALSADLQELLARRIDSFEKVELVLALRNAPLFTLAIDELASRLRVPRDILSSLVVELRSAMVIEQVEHGAVRLAVLTQAEQATIAELAAIYASDPIQVIKFLSEVAMTRIRSMASRAFADAFILRKKKGNRDDDG